MNTNEEVYLFLTMENMRAYTINSEYEDTSVRSTIVWIGY